MMSFWPEFDDFYKTLEPKELLRIYSDRLVAMKFAENFPDIYERGMSCSRLDVDMQSYHQELSDQVNKMRDRLIELLEDKGNENS